MKQSCKDIQAVDDPDTTQHLKACNLRCSKCYYSLHCQSLAKASFRAPLSCSGHGTVGSVKYRDLCRTCGSRPSSENLSIRTERERCLIDHRAGSFTRCGACRIRVAAIGPRWWACCRCNKECTSDYHSSWVK